MKYHLESLLGRQIESDEIEEAQQSPHKDDSLHSLWLNELYVLFFMRICKYI